uniref:Salivary lipocalin n=1 Tax=Ixodes ricinus TaxID=34613 RepID=V5H5C0_IXORI
MEVVSCLILLCVLVGYADAQLGEKRIDEYSDYWDYQDIRKALNNSDRISWMIYRTYSKDGGGSRHLCVYANVTGIGAVYTFEQGYIVSKGEQNTDGEGTFILRIHTKPINPIQN